MNLKLSPEKQLGFLEVLANTGLVKRACRAVSISRMTAYNWRDRDPAFNKAWLEAERVGTSVLKDKLIQRALEEEHEKTYIRGELVKVVTRPNNKMLLAALQMRERQEAQAEAKRIEEGKNSLKGLNPEQVAHRIKTILEAAARRREARLNQAVLELV